MSKHLLDATRRLCKTQIDVLVDGEFVPSPILINILRAPHDRDIKLTTTIHTMPGAPLKDFFNFRMRRTGEVWALLHEEINLREGVPYQTTYDVIRAEHRATLFREVDGKKSASGMAYESVEGEVSSFYTTVEHDRYFPTSKPIGRAGLSQVFVSYLPIKSEVHIGEDTIDLDNGQSFHVRTADSSGNMSIRAYLTLEES